MAPQRSGLFTLATALASASVAAAASCDTSALNTTTYLYPITVENTTVASVAEATNRGLCNLARYNFMADEVSMHALKEPKSFLPTYTPKMRVNQDKKNKKIKIKGARN